MSDIASRELISSLPRSFVKCIWQSCYGKISEKEFDKILEPGQLTYWNDNYYRFHNFSETMVAVFGTPDDLADILARFPFPSLWKKLATTPSFHFTYYFRDQLSEMRYKMGAILLRMETYRHIKKMIVAWYRQGKEGVLIIRNRKDQMPDIRVNIRFYPSMDCYFETAFSGRFSKDLEDGCFVIHTKREGTSQRVVQIYWEIYRKDKKAGKMALYEYLDQHKSSVEDLTDAMAEVQAVAKWDMMGYFVMLTQEYLMDYINDTFYNKSFKTSDRLLRFTSMDPIKAEYIWSVNFATEKQRFALAGELGIALRDQNKFIKSKNVEELQCLVKNKKNALQKHRSSIYDDLPTHIWNKIKDAENKLKQAEAGTPIGLFGRSRYYSSEDIEAARFCLKQAWIKADQWVGNNKKIKK